MLGALGMLAQKSGGNTDTILWVIAAVLVIAGIVALVRGSVLVGIVLFVLGLLVGPGGVSILDSPKKAQEGRPLASSASGEKGAGMDNPVLWVVVGVVGVLLLVFLFRGFGGRRGSRGRGGLRKRWSFRR